MAAVEEQHDDSWRHRWIKRLEGVSPTVKKLVPNKIKKMLRRQIGGDATDVIDLGDGAKMSYRIADKYWAHYANRIREYEPEIWEMADKFMTKDTVFVDCGANVGLWSAVAGAKIGNPEQVIAVEPGSSVLPQLYNNQGLNNNSYTVLPHAVWHRSGETLEFMVHEDHVGSSLKEEEGAKLRERIQVKTVAVDDIVDRATEVSGAKNVIVKLDVEGVETEALKGAARTLTDKNTMVIYEDHGKEKTSHTTQHFLDQGLNVYYLDPKPEGGVEAQQITGVGQLAAIKTNRHKGYNFIATRPGSEYDRELMEMCGKILMPAADDAPTAHRDAQQQRSQGSHGAWKV